jgi:hypothetical protein
VRAYASYCYSAQKLAVCYTTGRAYLKLFLFCAEALYTTELSLFRTQLALAYYGYYAQRLALAYFTYSVRLLGLLGFGGDKFIRVIKGLLGL